MKEIGGYMELELPKGGQEFHDKAIALNTARNAFEYCLRVGNYKKVYIPLYHCTALMTPIERLGIPYEFYNIGYDFKFSDFPVANDEAILYTNFYGIMDQYVEELAQKYPTLIVDNAHAFFSPPLPGVPTFYSCRKFFGVPDGAYLYSNTLLPGLLEQDNSYDRYTHLIGRIDQTGNQHFAFYRKIEKMLDDEPIKLMSRSTQIILSTPNYNAIKQTRLENYTYLHNELKSMNRLSLPDKSYGMSYPLLATKALRDKLIQQKVYMGVYWPHLITETLSHTFEYDISLNLVNLPIDQRYNLVDMVEIEKKIRK